MPKLNENFLRLKTSYLFSEVAHRTAAYIQANPDKPVIRLGIGDVTKPLTGRVISSLHEAVDEMASADTFKGYGPEQGYPKLREAISAYYAKSGVIDFLQMDCAMYAAKSRPFPAEDGVQSAQREH